MQIENLSNLFPFFRDKNASYEIKAIKTDKKGNLYLSGTTNSDSLYLKSPLQNALLGKQNIFIIKLNPQQTGEDSILFSTYLGGSGEDIVNDAVVDDDENIYITGATTSPDFPIKNNLPHKPTGHRNAFVCKIGTKDKALHYASYLGGEQETIGNGIAIDESNCVYLTGSTNSIHFPITTNALQRHIPVNTTAYLSKVTVKANGEPVLLYSTFLGGNGHDGGVSVVARDGVAYLTGFTNSNQDFPISRDALLRHLPGKNYSAFLTKIDTKNSGPESLSYSTYIGGSGQDLSIGMAVDDQERAYITGSTNSRDLLGQPSKSINTDKNDVFLLRIATKPTTEQNYLAYLGGSGSDIGQKIALTSDGRVCLSGVTTSTDFIGDDKQQDSNVFLVEIDPATNKVDQMSYIPNLNDCQGMTFDHNSNVYVCGRSSDKSAATVLKISNDQATSLKVSQAQAPTQAAPQNSTTSPAANPAQTNENLTQRSSSNGSQKVGNHPEQNQQKSSQFTLTKPEDYVMLTDTMNGSNVAFPLPKVSSNDNRPISIVCSPPQGTFFPIGVTNVNVTARDDQGNIAYTYFDVIVRPKPRHVE